MPTTPAPSGSRSFWKSAWAIFLGALTVIATSLGTDQLFHALDVFPPWGEPMNDTGDNVLALSYRCIYAVLGSYVTAEFAPDSPWRHVWIGAGIGFVLTCLGAIAAMNANLGPFWYPIALALTTLPCAWLGGTLYYTRHTGKVLGNESTT